MRLARWATGAALVLLALSWLPPNHYPPWYSFHSELLAFVATTMLVAGTLAASGRQTQLPQLSLWIFGAACIPWLQWATGISFFSGDALVVILYLSAFLGAIWVGHAASNSLSAFAPLMPKLMLTVWIGAFASSCIGLLQWLSLQGPLPNLMVSGEGGARALGNLAQPNHLATLLLMGMVALTYFFERRLIGPLALGSGIAFMSLVLVQTQSRTGLLSAIAIAGFFLFHQRERAPRLKFFHVLFWALGLVAANLLLPRVHELMLMGSARTIDLTNGSGRWLMWRQVAYGAWESPWFGYGWNQTPTAHSVGAFVFPGELSFTNAHSFVLDMVAWNGIPVGLLLTAACLYWLASRAWHARNIDGWHAMACLTPFVIHSMLEFPFPYAYFLLPAGILVGIVEATHNSSRKLQIKSPWLWWSLILWVGMGCAVVREYFLVEEDFRIVRFENIRVGTTPSSYQVPEIRLLTHLGAMLVQARVQARPGMSQDELHDLEQVALRFPYASLAFRYAVALGLNGDPAGATHQMAIVRGMYGKKYYQQATSELRALEREKYPQLHAVQTP